MPDAPTQPEQSPSEGAALGSGVRTVSGITLASRLLGLVRDLVTVRMFGDTAAGSAFAAAFAVPNVFRRLFGEGALSAAFLPDYARLSDTDREQANAFASLTVAALFVITGLITVAIEAALAIVVFNTNGDDLRADSLRLVMLMLPYMPLICGAAILGGMLQAHGRFAPWAAAPIILNLCIIAAAVPFFIADESARDPMRWAFFIGGSVLLSGVLQLLWSALALRGFVRWTREVAGALPVAKAMLLRMGPVILGLGALQLNSLIDTLIAMWPLWIGPTIAGYKYPLDEASNAILFFSQRLYQFPLGVFGIAVATVAFPELSRLKDNTSAFGAALARAIRLSLFIGLPATAGLIAVRDPLIQTLFTGGVGEGFSAEGVDRAAAVLLGYAAAVWAYSLNHVYARAFYAMDDTATPMRAAIAMLALNLTLNLVLIWPLGEAGLAWSTAIAAIGQTLLLRHWSRQTLRGQESDTGITKSAALSVFGSLAVFATAALCVRLFASEDWAGTALALAVATVAGATVYATIALAAKRPEIRWLLGRSR